jgi:protocatechuate 3,4-dioxygenase beta subunit
MDIALRTAAAIAGVVLDEHGEPLEAAPVWLFESRFVNGERRLEEVRGNAVAGVANASDVTDDLGQFRLFGLLPGTYYLAAGPPGRPETSARRQGQNVATPTLYPGTLTLAGAQPITVAEATR